MQEQKQPLENTVTAPETKPANMAKDTLPLRVWKTLLFTLKHADQKNLTQVASSLTYISMLAIVPMLTVMLALFTAFPLFADFQEALESFLANNLMPPAVSDNIMGYLNQFAAKASGLTTIGTAFLVVMSIRVIMTIDVTLNNIWNVRRQRPFRQRLLVYWAIITLGPVLAGASLWSTSVLAEYSIGSLHLLTPELRLAASLIPLIVTGLAFSTLFVMVPNRHVYWRDAMAGGFFTALILTAMKWGFAYYLKHFPSYTIIYGAFATVPIFLLWVYMSWLGVLSGAALAAILPALRLKRWLLVRHKAATFVDALYVLQHLRASQGSPTPGLRTAQLANTLQVQIDELDEVLDMLQAAAYVVSTQDSGVERWVLSCDPHTEPLGKLIDLLLIERSQPGLSTSPELLPIVAKVLAGDERITLAQALELIQNPACEDKPNTNPAALSNT